MVNYYERLMLMMNELLFFNVIKKNFTIHENHKKNTNGWYGWLMIIPFFPML